MKTILKNTLILLAITLVAGVALSFVYELTKEPIAAAEQQKKENAYREVYATAATFEPINGMEARLEDHNAAMTDGTSIQEILAAKSEDGELLGYVLTTNSSKGYGGNVTLALGIDKTGKVVGYAVLSHSESPGFGANCVNPEIAEQFTGITSTDGVDGISGATYTTKALKTQVQAAIDYVVKMGGEAA